MGSSVIVSFEKLVYTDEMIDYARRMKGFEVSEEAFFFDEIDEEGPGGNFLAAESTIDNMREYRISGISIPPHDSFAVNVSMVMGEGLVASALDDAGRGSARFRFAFGDLRLLRERRPAHPSRAPRAARPRRRHLRGLRAVGRTWVRDGLRE